MAWATWRRDPNKASGAAGVAPLVPFSFSKRALIGLGCHLVSASASIPHFTFGLDGTLLELHSNVVEPLEKQRYHKTETQDVPRQYKSPQFKREKTYHINFLLDVRIAPLYSACKCLSFGHIIIDHSLYLSSF